MAKNMARIENGIVVNVEWCSDKQEQTDFLIPLDDRPVGIGDTYNGSDFYRNGVKVLSPYEMLQEQLAQLKAELADADAALNELGVNVDG